MISEQDLAGFVPVQRRLERDVSHAGRRGRPQGRHVALLHNAK